MNTAVRRSSVWFLCLLVLVAWGLGGCAKKPAPDTTTAAEGAAVTEMESREVRGIEEGRMREGAVTETGIPGADAEPELQRIFFEFDQYTLTPQSREILEENAAYLKAHPGASVRIEGHCDERGSDEYNLALGERRAQAAQSYLVTLGIDPGRLTTVSYGEERPLDPRSTEEAWAKNRRAEFEVVR